MHPALRDGDIALVGGRRRSLSRGRIIAFRARTGNETAAVRVKRVVGLPGEVVEFRDGLLFIDGAHLPEAYLGGLPAYIGLESASWTLGEGDYFVMGDNRARSSDSREHGPAREEDVIGAVVARIPLSAVRRRLPLFRRRRR